MILGGKAKRKLVKTIRRLIWIDLSDRRGFDLRELDNDIQLEIIRKWDRIIDRWLNIYLTGHPQENPFPKTIGDYVGAAMAAEAGK